VEELVRAVLTLHGAGLEHLLNLLNEPQVRQLVGDDLLPEGSGWRVAIPGVQPA
jgi:hypothetical protein